jgi:phosphoribosylamine--glycine ligase
VRALIVGGGGREHALAWKLRQDSPDIDLIAAPGNPGIAAICRCVDLPIADLAALAALAEAERADLTLVGPEAPLAAGIVNHFRERGLPIFGPTREAAAIETSKSFAKALMVEAGVPTARASRHTEPAPAKRAVRELGAPVVVKASGLAAGKGVIICGSIAEADQAIDQMLQDGIFGEAGAEILVEEFMEGEELSLFGITDGSTVLPMLPAQDHKRLLDGDNGPNTGGMGAYAPVAVGSHELVERALQVVFQPTLDALRRHGRPFSGLLYAGLMLTGEGPKVVEFNCRFGDPETEAILPLMESSLLDTVLAVARGESLAGAPPIRWRPGFAVTTVVAASGYPGKVRTGDSIELPRTEEGVLVFHAGTALAPDGGLITAGGRIFAVTATDGSFERARDRSVAHAGRLRFAGSQFRRDIGWRELSRSARAT